MRKGFNGLHALVTERPGENPRTDALFVFINWRMQQLKNQWAVQVVEKLEDILICFDTPASALPSTPKPRVCFLDSDCTGFNGDYSNGVLCNHFDHTASGN